MARARLSRQAEDAVIKIAWVLLAVDRFGTYGSYAAEGAALLKVGLIEPINDGFQVTEKGLDMVKRINASRGV